MRKTSFALALLTAAVLAACGGTSPSSGDQTPATKFSNQVSFGDSLSDVGSYAVGTIKALGGGKFTINGDNTTVNAELTGKNWTEVVAAQLGLPAPCSAQTGLEGDASQGFAVPITYNATCYNYAQGGSRVTNPIGQNNKALNATLGLTTVPVTTQIANHLAKSSGKFSGTELVTVMAGGNDLIVLLGALQASATTAGNQAFAASLVAQLAAGATAQNAAQTIGQAVQNAAAASGATPQSIVQAGVIAATQAGFTNAAAQATTIAATAQAAGTKAGTDYAAANAAGVVQAMTVAGTELANLVKTQIVAKGANYVVVNNLPDVASTPSGKSQSESIQALIKTAVDAFNAQLKAGVESEAKVVYVDLYTISHDQVINPGPYGLTNTSTPACGANKLGTTALVCNKTNLIAGDVSHYMFADDVHPSPFENALVARYVLLQMSGKGWL